MAKPGGPWQALGYATRAAYRAAVKAATPAGQKPHYTAESAARRAREGTGYGHDPAARARRQARAARTPLTGLRKLLAETKAIRAARVRYRVMLRVTLNAVREYDKKNVLQALERGEKHMTVFRTTTSTRKDIAEHNLEDALAAGQSSTGFWEGQLKLEGQIAEVLDQQVMAAK